MTERELHERAEAMQQQYEQLQRLFEHAMKELAGDIGICPMDRYPSARIWPEDCEKACEQYTDGSWRCWAQYFMNQDEGIV